MSRIALLPSAYSPGLGGVEEMTRHLALTLRSAGDDVEVWSNRNDAPERPAVEILDGIVVRRFALPLPSVHPRTYLRSAVGAIGTLRRLRAAAADFRPDVLNVHCFGPNGPYGTALSRITGVPLVISLHGETRMDDQDIFDRSLVFRAGLRWGIRRSARVTGCSQFTLSDAELRFGLTPGTGRVIFNGVSLDGSPSSRPGARRFELGRYVLALGRVVEKKGFDLLLRAWSGIADHHPDVTLAIGGGGPALPRLRELADTLGVGDRVRFLGRCTRDEVAELMRRAELFVMPSRLEPFGIVVLEAWRAGTPVICTSHGGPPEFVTDGVTGLIVDPFDPAKLAGAIERLLLDAELTALMRANVLQEVTKFGWPEIAGQYRECYRDAIGRRVGMARRPG